MTRGLLPEHRHDAGHLLNQAAVVPLGVHREAVVVVLVGVAEDQADGVVVAGVEDGAHAHVGPRLRAVEQGQRAGLVRHSVRGVASVDVTRLYDAPAGDRPVRRPLIDPFVNDGVLVECVRPELFAEEQAGRSSRTRRRRTVAPRRPRRPVRAAR